MWKIKIERCCIQLELRKCHIFIDNHHFIISSLYFLIKPTFYSWTGPQITLLVLAGQSINKTPVLSIELIIPRFICKQVNESVKQKCSMGLKCKIVLNLFIFCSKYVQSNLNQPSRIPKRRGPVVPMSSSDTDCVASADSAEEMVVIAKSPF